MRRRFAHIVFALVTSTLLGAGAAPTTRPDVSALIEDLAAPDPGARARAVSELKKIGAPARDALVEATHDADPEVRTRAASILASLPLVRPGDGPVVRRLLERYRATEASERQSFIDNELARERDLAAITVLVRVLTDAIAEEDRWAASRALRVRRDPGAMRAVRDVPDIDRSENVPLLLAVGLAWQGRETHKGDGILRRAVDVAAGQGAPVDPEVVAVMAQLTEVATVSHRFDDALHLLRLRAVAEPAQWPDTPNRATAELLAVHAEHGPFPGLARDVVLVGPTNLFDPTTLYSVARLLQRLDRPWLARAVAGVAPWLGSSSGIRRASVGQFLFELGWDDWAAGEFAAPVSAPSDEAEGATFDAYDRDARLALIAADAKEHTRAAELTESALAALPEGTPLVRPDRRGSFRPYDAADLRVEALYQRLLAARQTGDAKGVTDRLNDLMFQPLTDPNQYLDMVCDLLPMLRERKRDGEATNLFDQLYQFHKARLDTDPESPEFLNNVAWLSARSNERAEEAARLAHKANATDVDNAAYLDTEAEAHFRLGNFDEAIRLESRALELRPNDKFMTEQLARFKTGKSKLN